MEIAKRRYYWACSSVFTIQIVRILLKRCLFTTHILLSFFFNRSSGYETDIKIQSAFSLLNKIQERKEESGFFLHSSF